MDFLGKRTGKLAQGIVESMNRKTLTTVIIFAVTGALILYDVWASFVPGATISEVMLKLGHYHPIIPFGLGILMGHFFWSQQAESLWMVNPTSYQRSVELGTPLPLSPYRVGYIPLLLGIMCIALGIILTLTVR
jgi:hypothetical protein